MLLFLSHSGADTAAAVELKRRILSSPAAQDAKLQVWLDKDDLRAGGPPWQTQLTDALEQATAFCVYVGSGGVMNWVEREVQLGLSRATGPGAIPFIPVLAAEAKSGALPPFARQHQAVRDPLGNPEALAELVAGALGRTGDLPLVDEPFVGLRSMDEAEAHLFFGREGEVEDLATRLRRHPLVAVVADSGAGKSSLVRAGLVPAFRGGALAGPDQPERPGALRHVVIMRPGTHPVEGLRNGVTQAAAALGLSGEERAGLRRRVDLRDPGETAHAIRCDLPPDRTEVLLVVDQFEELLTQANPGEAQDFVDLLMALVDPAARSGLRVVLTVRADYFNLISRFPDLFGRLTAEEGAAQLRLKRVSDAGLRELVCRPLKMAGHADPSDAAALLQAVRSDISDRPGDLALVQMALYATWRQARQERLPLAAAYAKVGGVMGALAHQAERVVATLGATERELLLPLFARLFALGDTGGATRRNVPLVDLDAPTQALACKLAGDEGGRLLQVGETAVEISHEALIMQWPWLQDRIQANAGDIRRLARLTDAARAWEESQHKPEALPNERMRQGFAGLRDRHPDWVSALEVAFLTAAEDAALDRRRTERSARRRLMAVTVFAVLFALAATGLAWTTKSNASRAQASAIEAQNVALLARQAEQRALAAQDQALEEAQRARQSEMKALAAQSTVALQQGRLADALELALEAWPRSEGSMLPQTPEALQAFADASFNQRERLRLHASDLAVASVAFSPNGRLLATGSKDGAIRIWDATTGERGRMILQEHGQAVTSLAYSPDGLRLAAGFEDGTARLWDAVAGRPIGAMLRGHLDIVSSVAFSPDGRRLVTGSWDGTAVFWDGATGARDGTKTIRIDQDITSLAFSPGGAFLATATGDGTVMFWKATTAKRSALEIRGEGDAVQAMVFSPDGTRLATAMFDGTARLWDAATGQRVGLLEGGHLDALTSVAFSPDGLRLATGSWDGTARLWDTATGAPVGYPLLGHASRVTSVVFSPDGLRLATGSWDGTARLWDVTAKAALWSTPERHGGKVWGVTFSPDGTRIATGSMDGTARLWDAATGKPAGPAIGGHDGEVTSVDVSPDGAILATGSADGTARLWSVATGEAAGPALVGHDGVVWDVDISPDGALVSTGSADGTARLWDAATGEPFGPVLDGHGAGVTAVGFSPDGGLLATGSVDRTVRLWDVATGQPGGPVLVGHGDAIESLAFSPDGTLLATASADGTVRLWLVATGERRGPLLRGLGGVVTGVAFASGGRYLAAGATDGMVAVWDVATAARIGPALEQQASGVASIAFSPQGMRLAVGGDDGQVRLWDLSDMAGLSGFDRVCELVPLRAGDPEAGPDQTVEASSEPICGPDYDPPPPWWSAPAAN